MKHARESAAQVDVSLSHHILPSSATMVGVCITAVSIVKLIRITGIGSFVSHLLAFNSLIFLTSAVLSYAAMRSTRHLRYERWADIAFISGLAALSACTIIIALVIQ